MHSGRSSKLRRGDQDLDMIRGTQIKRFKREPHRVPDELLFEILSRLPARSVIRFRCVCKLWQSINNNPYFIDAHLDRARKAGPPSILCFVSNHKWDRFGITIIDHYSRTPKRTLWGPKPRLLNLYLGNSCNGLLCMYHHQSVDERIRVINPTTAETLILPEHTKTGASNCLGAFLGFLPETKEYKVIRFFSRINDMQAQVECEVYTLGTTSWRQIYNHDHYSLPRIFSSPVVAKGAVYWLADEEESYEWDGSALSFDLKSETFTKFLLPDSETYVDDEDDGDCDLVELQDSVCYMVTLQPEDCASRQMDIWTMTLNTDDINDTKYEWAKKYSVYLAIGADFSSMPAFIHDDKILVRTRRNHVEGVFAELIYFHLGSNSQDGTIFYSEGKLASPLVYHYLKGEYVIDEDLFRDCRILGGSPPYVHIESLVPLQSQ